MPTLLADGHELNYETVGPAGVPPSLVFLHEGLGSVELWRSFPADVAEASGRGGVVYDRYGHGWSDPLTGPRPVSFMHREGQVSFPEVRSALGLQRPVLVGHSDGGSIAIVHAGSGHDVAAMVLIAAHVFVEEECLGGLHSAWERYEHSDLADKMGRYHRDPHATFRGWGEVWISDEFRSWDITEYLAAISCPVLVIQGLDDPYGTPAQVEAIAAGVSGPVETLLLPECGHSPHLEQPDVVVPAVVDFLAGIG